jgi:hypothetical protein
MPQKQPPARIAVSCAVVIRCSSVVAAGGGVRTIRT